MNKTITTSIIAFFLNNAIYSQKMSNCFQFLEKIEKKDTLCIINTFYYQSESIKIYKEGKELYAICKSNIDPNKHIDTLLKINFLNKLTLIEFKYRLENDKLLDNFEHLSRNPTYSIRYRNTKSLYQRKNYYSLLKALLR